MPLSKLSTVILSHLHFDHISDFPALPYGMRLPPTAATGNFPRTSPRMRPLSLLRLSACFPTSDWMRSLCLALATMKHPMLPCRCLRR
ncbi:MAG TPA: hypothetical protein GX729_02570 [Firmicutes bacterium]|nr:hypothetical protein [Bacillota bacterium]